MKKIKVILFIISLFSSISYSQDCTESFNYYKYVNCSKCIDRNYNIYAEPKNIEIGINDTLKYNIMLYGNRDYIVSFCANELYYPIHIKLLSQETKQVIYDNALDGYIESIGVGFYNNQNLTVEVTLLANDIGKERKDIKEKICVGMILQWKKISYKIEK